jgi:hypothetical protein
MLEVVLREASQDRQDIWQRYIQKKMWTLLGLGKILKKVSKFGHKESKIPHGMD